MVALIKIVECKIHTTIKTEKAHGPWKCGPRACSRATL